LSKLSDKTAQRKAIILLALLKGSMHARLFEVLADNITLFLCAKVEMMMMMMM
jgi:hypothetical protein